MMIAVTGALGLGGQRSNANSPSYAFPSLQPLGLCYGNMVPYGLVWYIQVLEGIVIPYYGMEEAHFCSNIH